MTSGANSTPPGGTVVGTDEVTIGGTLQHVQRVKLVDGTDGGTALIAGDSANGLDVDVTRLNDGGNSITVDAVDLDIRNLTAATDTVVANAGTGTFTVDQADTASLDYDTGAGTVNQTVVGIALPGSGGPVAGGTSANPVRTDPTGTTTQPISGTVTANAGTGVFDVTPASPSASDYLPARLTDGTIFRGDGTNPLRVDPTGTTTQPVSGTINVGTFPDNEPFNLNQLAGTALATPFDVDTGAGTQNIAGVSIRKAASGGSVEYGTSTDPIRVDPTGTTTQPISGTVTSNQGTAAAQSNRWPTFISDGSAERIGQQTMANSLPVAIASNQSAVPVTVSSGSVVVADGGGLLHTNLRDALGNEIASAISAPAGTERALLTRNIPTGTQVIEGKKTNNAAAPGTTNAGTLPGVATASAPSYTEGNQVALSLDLSGSTRVSGTVAISSGSVVVTDGGGSLTVDQGAPAIGANAWAIAVTDTSNVIVKAGDTANNAVRVNVVAGSGGGVTHTDDAPFTPGTDDFVPAGGTYRSVRDLVDDNDAGVFAMTQRRALLTVIETPNADSAMDDANDAVRVNVVAGGGAGGGTSMSDEGGWTEGTTAFTPIGGAYNPTFTTPPGEDWAATARITARRAFHVNLRDDAGNEFGTSGSPISVAGTKSNNAATPGATNLGTLPAVATTSAPSYSEGNQVGLSTDLTGALRIAGGAGGTSLTDEASFTEGSGSFTPIGGVYNPARTTPVGEDWAATALITKNRAIHTNLRDDSGNEFGTSGSPVRIDPTGTTTQPVSGTVNIGTFPDNEPFNLNQYGGTATTLGQKAMTASMPIVIASDQSAVAVSGTVTANQGTAAAQSNRWPTFISDGSAERIGQQTMANSLPVAIASNQSAISVMVSSGSVVIADGGGSITVDTPQLPSALVGNRLDVNVGNTPTVTANAGTGDFLVVTGHTINEAFKEANAVGGQLDDTATTAATENNIAPVRITAQRAFHANLRNDGGTEIGTASTPVRTDPTGTTTQPVSGTVTANAGTGNFNVIGTKSNNGGAPGTTNLGTLPAVATASAPSYSEGNQVGLSVDLAGALRTAGGAGGTSMADEASFTEGSTSFTPIGGVYNPTRTNPVGEDWGAAALITKQRAVHVNLRDDSGNEFGTSGSPIRVDPTGTTTQPVSGTVTANQGTAAAQSNRWPIFISDGSAERVGQQTMANSVPVAIASNQSAVSVTISSGSVVIADGGGVISIDGITPHDSPVAFNPVLIGASHETMADAVPDNRVTTDGDVTRLSATDGALFVIPTGPQTWSYHENSSSALTDATVKAAPGTGLSLYVTDVICSTGAATAFNIFFEEGATTVLGPYYLEAVAGRGLAIHFGTPKKITANTALTVTTSAAIAHGIDVTGFIARG